MPPLGNMSQSRLDKTTHLFMVAMYRDFFVQNLSFQHEGEILQGFFRSNAKSPAQGGNPYRVVSLKLKVLVRREIRIEVVPSKAKSPVQMEIPIEIFSLKLKVIPIEIFEKNSISRTGTGDMHLSTPPLFVDSSHVDNKNPTNIGGSHFR